MKTIIIFAHPWHGSFNKGILDKVVLKLEKKNKEYEIIDLNKEEFNPVLDEKNLSFFSEGKTLDPQVEDYQNKIKEADELIFIFPIWWFSTPAILKGFIDKVMLKGFAYDEGKGGILISLLPNIKSTILITTSEAPTWYIRYNSKIKSIFKAFSKSKIRWINNGRTTSGSEKSKKLFLEKIYKNI